MLLLILLLAVSCVHGVLVSVDFTNTIIPRGNDVDLVCEAVNIRYGGNVSTCYDRNQTELSTTMNLRLNIQTVDLANKTDVLINVGTDLDFINQYLFDNGFFDFPDKSRASNVYVFEQQLVVAYLVSILGILTLLVLLLLTTQDLHCGKKRPKYADEESRTLVDTIKPGGARAV